MKTPTCLFDRDYGRMWIQVIIIMINKEKVRNQVKSRFYYIFWGVATFSVVAGQLYVGSGYRMFGRSLNRILDTIQLEVGQTYNNERFY